MKLKIALHNPRSLVEYFEEIEFQEIKFFSEYCVLKNGKRRKKIVHYWFIEQLIKDKDTRKFYEIFPGVLTKNTPVMMRKDFEDLVQAAKNNNIPMSIALEA